MNITFKFNISHNGKNKRVQVTVERNGTRAAQLDAALTILHAKYPGASVRGEHRVA